MTPEQNFNPYLYVTEIEDKYIHPLPHLRLLHIYVCFLLFFFLKCYLIVFKDFEICQLVEGSFI